MIFANLKLNLCNPIISVVSLDSLLYMGFGFFAGDSLCLSASIFPEPRKPPLDTLLYLGFNGGTL